MSSGRAGVDLDRGLLHERVLAVRGDPWAAWGTLQANVALVGGGSLDAFFDLLVARMRQGRERCHRIRNGATRKRSMAAGSNETGRLNR